MKIIKVNPPGVIKAAAAEKQISTINAGEFFSYFIIVSLHVFHGNTQKCRQMLSTHVNCRPVNIEPVFRGTLACSNTRSGSAMVCVSHLVVAENNRHVNCPDFGGTVPILALLSRCSAQRDTVPIEDILTCIPVFQIHTLNPILFTEGRYQTKNRGLDANHEHLYNDIVLGCPKNRNLVDDLMLQVDLELQKQKDVGKIGVEKGVTIAQLQENTSRKIKDVDKTKRHKVLLERYGSFIA